MLVIVVLGPTDGGMSLLLLLDWQVPEWLKRPWFSFLNQAMETEEAAVVLIFALIVIGLLGFWLWWDSYDFFDFLGALALLLAFLIISPLVLFAYLGAKFLAFGVTWARTRPTLAQERWFRRWGVLAMRHRRPAPRPLSRKDYQALIDIKIDDELSPEEVDPNIEEMVKSGRKDDAIEYVRDILKVAQSMKDNRAVKRYEKYLLILRLGHRKSYGGQIIY